MRSSKGRCRLLLVLPLIFVLFHLLSVWEWHQDPATAIIKKKRQVKFDHLILGPAAGQGLQNRLHCQGIRALNQTHRTHSHVYHNEEGVAFVTVFSIYNSSNNEADRNSPQLITVGNSRYTKLEKSMAILHTFIEFIQMTMPQSKIFILTDPASDLHIERERVQLYPIEGDYSRDMLMLQRIRSYIAFLDSREAELLNDREHKTIHYIFTDSDIAVVDDLHQIFFEYPGFDLALTFRNNKDQPLNSGFMAVRGTAEGIQKAKSFLMEVLETYSGRFMKAARMLGDQLALVWVVKSHASFDLRQFYKPTAFTEKISGATILFLPCALYNWTPPEGAGQFHGMPLDVKVVHFKGSRKRLMLEAWHLYNSTHNMDDMLCLVLASGRTKYDF